MARPLLVRIFADELPIKILSMVLAVTLFVLVRNDKDATSGAYVKVIYTLPEDRVLVSDPVPEIKVSVRGPWTKLQHLDRSLEALPFEKPQPAEESAPIVTTSDGDAGEAEDTKRDADPDSTVEAKPAESS